MAFVTTTSYTSTGIDLAAIVARARAALERLPLGEERFTGSAHQPRVSDGGPKDTGTSYRPTYALQVV